MMTTITNLLNAEAAMERIPHDASEREWDKAEARVNSLLARIGKSPKLIAEWEDALGLTWEGE